MRGHRGRTRGIRGDAWDEIINLNTTTMENMTMTTANVTIIDRITSAIWEIGHRIKSAKRRKVTARHADAVIAARRVL